LIIKEKHLEVLRKAELFKKVSHVLNMKQAGGSGADLQHLEMEAR
jgi:hypothetical protein